MSISSRSTPFFWNDQSTGSRNRLTTPNSQRARLARYAEPQPSYKYIDTSEEWNNVRESFRLAVTEHAHTSGELGQDAQYTHDEADGFTLRLQERFTHDAPEIQEIREWSGILHDMYRRPQHPELKSALLILGGLIDNLPYDFSEHCSISLEAHRKALWEYYKDGVPLSRETILGDILEAQSGILQAMRGSANTARGDHDPTVYANTINQLSRALQALPLSASSEPTPNAGNPFASADPPYRRGTFEYHESDYAPYQ